MASNRDNMGRQEVDDRPWFQVIKRRKSVIDTVNQENILNTMDSNSNRNSNRSYSERRIDTAIPFECRVRDRNQRSRSNKDRHYNAMSGDKQDIAGQEDAASPRPQGAFRSGLQLLIESET